MQATYARYLSKDHFSTHPVVCFFCNAINKVSKQLSRRISRVPERCISLDRVQSFLIFVKWSHAQSECTAEIPNRDSSPLHCRAPSRQHNRRARGRTYRAQKPSAITLPVPQKTLYPAPHHRDATNASFLITINNHLLPEEIYKNRWPKCWRRVDVKTDHGSLPDVGVDEARMDGVDTDVGVMKALGQFTDVHNVGQLGILVGRPFTVVSLL